ncbi:MAG: hypothetical protein PWP52_2346 [Bacteroidales bacterium]|nr:hypothetical protein [Bacteroidales bacterium]
MIKIFGLRIYTKKDMVKEWIDGFEVELPKDISQAILLKFNLIRTDVYRLCGTKKRGGFKNEKN